MEKVAVNLSPEHPKNKPTLHVDIFRHGEANYSQREVTIEEANDLTEAGIKKTRLGAEELSKLILPDEEVLVWASPFGRAIHTAKIIVSTLEQNDIKVRRKGKTKETGIAILDRATEVRQFSWNIYNSLVNGGEIEINGSKLIVDKSITNPSNLNSTDYFIEDGIQKISDDAKKQLSEDYIKEIKKIETFTSVTKRIMKLLSKIKNIENKSYRIIIVTHESLMTFISDIFSGGQKREIYPGEFLDLERKNGKLVATRVGDLHQGNSDVDMIEEFNKKTSR